MNNVEDAIEAMRVRFANLERVADAAKALQADLIMRAEIGTYDGDFTVQCGCSVWNNICTAIEELEK